MAGVDPPGLPSTPEGDSSFNEKIDEKGANNAVEVTNEVHGDMYDDTRAIDLGADGKERPIGKLSFRYPTRKEKQ